MNVPAWLTPPHACLYAYSVSVHENPRWYNPAVTTNNWAEALTRTRKSTFGRISSVFGVTELKDSFWDELEAALIQADLGVELSLQIIEDLHSRTKDSGWTKVSEVQPALLEMLIDLVQAPPTSDFDGKPRVILLVGVNGSGKTTTAARLGYAEQRDGHTLIFAAADTYRAAACEQLKVWGEQLRVEVICGQPGGDAGAVVYDASKAAIARDCDLLIVDTSGRMHTEHNLMAELRKIVKVQGNVIDGAPHQTLLVLDATTGQNGIAQARSFGDSIHIDGVVLAKLDNSAKGGVGLAVKHELGLPILYVGLGEGIEALAPFDPEAYVSGLLPAYPEKQIGGEA